MPRVVEATAEDGAFAAVVTKKDVLCWVIYADALKIL